MIISVTNPRPATHPIYFAADSPDKILRLYCVGGIFLQIEPYVVVQFSEIRFRLFTAQPQSVILVLERSRT